MKYSKKCVDLVKKWESLELNSYLCPAGVWTIGYGSIRHPNGKAIKEGESITEELAEEYLKKELDWRGEALTQIVGKRLTQNQFDAVLSWCFNFSPHRLKMTNLLTRILNNPNDLNIADEFLRWRNASGKPLRGLLLRRIDEVQLYFT